ncbi:DUF2079 domain-containing protein [Lyngbya sp. CCY1209]|uniref:DUF2079 domain-containing protein n=1 Tax=Lyngbya sp. CCY1209 TaxID=2886103 RepID=UPI002D2179D6|nr:DUF2079 domain-containing protein [Lyngbya sp. CCY1209]MEB3884735.1 DUF2079 domain-containing protein [Lyngbya sp. CCY1209]
MSFSPSKRFQFHPVALMMAIAFVVLFAASSLRHNLFQSTAFELGIYDQVVYLISRGEPPISSFLNIHHMGNHAAWAVYPLGILYWIYPSVYWLFLVQAISLAAGVWPTWGLARLAGLDRRVSAAVAAAYLLYPVVFNINLFDFHPEVMAGPALLAAILAARCDRTLWFTVAIIWILGCKDALSLTVIGMGFWLYFCEKKRRCGAIALFLGTVWFAIAVGVIIPYFKEGGGPGGVGRYTYLGDSIPEIIINLVFKPKRVLERVFSPDSLEYLALVFSPVIFWLSPRHLSPLVATVPVLAKNMLSDIQAQRDLIHQYSVPIVPFLMVAIIATLAEGKGYLGKYLWVWFWRDRSIQCIGSFNYNLHKLIVVWSLIGFVSLAKFGYFWSIYLEEIDTWSASGNAVARVYPDGSVLTTANLAPHLTHRRAIEFTNSDAKIPDLTQFDQVLLNLRHPGWRSSREFANFLFENLQNSDDFEIQYSQDDVYLFKKIY